MKTERKDPGPKRKESTNKKPEAGKPFDMFGKGALGVIIRIDLGAEQNLKIRNIGQSPMNFKHTHKLLKRP